MTAQEARREYHREWRRKNPEKVKAAAERYWEKKAAEMAAQEQQEGGNNERIANL